MFFLLRWRSGWARLRAGAGRRMLSAPDAKIDAGQAITVASAAMSDARGFCERQPQACIAGGQVAAALGHKAEDGARTLYQFISAKLAEKPAEKAEKPAAKSGRSTSTRSPTNWRRFRAVSRLPHAARSRERPAAGLARRRFRCPPRARSRTPGRLMPRPEQQRHHARPRDGRRRKDSWPLRKPGDGHISRVQIAFVPSPARYITAA